MSVLSSYRAPLIGASISAALLAIGCTEQTTGPSDPGLISLSVIASGSGPTLTTVYALGNSLTRLTPSESTQLADLSGGLGYGIVLSHDGSTAYVTIGPHFVRAYDVATGTVLAEATLLSIGTLAPPIGVAVTPDGQYVLAGTASGSFFTEGTLHILEAGTLAPVGMVDGVGFNPQPIAVSPDGRHAYVGDRASDGFVTAVDLTTRQVTGRVSVPGGGTEGSNSIAITADGSSLYVTHYNAATVVVIDAATMTLTTSYSTCAGVPCGPGIGPKGIALSPDESRVYIGYRTGFLQIRRAVDFGLERTVALSSFPSGIDAVAVSRDGQRVYVSSLQSGFVRVLDATGNLQQTFNTPAVAMALLETTPDETPIGSGVVVQPLDQTTGGLSPVTLTFSTVTGEGQTTVASSSGGQPPPLGFKLGTPPVYYEVQTTALFTGSITVCFTYDPTAFHDASNLHLFHGGSGSPWTDVTASVDPSTSTICGSVDSLSPFILAELRYDFEGFFQPVDNPTGDPPVVNVAKAGSAIPVRFSLDIGLGLDVLKLGSPSSMSYGCTVGATDAVEETVTSSSNGLSYHEPTGQYVYIWKTEKAWAGTCRILTVTLRDGTSHPALFDFRR